MQQRAAIQRHATNAAPGADQVREAAGRGIQGPATSLPHAAAIQQAFGPAHSISHVQAHVGAGAADACRDMNATAYATGSHIAFAGAPDLHTAAHEAAHVVQQAQGVNLYGGVGAVGDAYERHADDVADRVVAGQSAADLLSSGPQAGATGSAGAAVQRHPTGGTSPAGGTPNPAGGAPPGGSPTPAPATPAAALTGTLDSVALQGSHAMTANGAGPDARANATWTAATVATHAAAYTAGTSPQASVQITLNAAAPAASAPKLRATIAGANTDVTATIAGTALTATVTLGLLPNVFGQGAHTISWSASADGTTFSPIGTSTHPLYWLVGNPIGTLYSKAANRATGFAPLAGDPATALRMGAHQIPYDPAGPFKATEPEALTMFDGGAFVCASFGNLLVVLARSVGLSAEPVLYFGGVKESGVDLWINSTPGGPTMHHVMPGDWTFNYHAFAVIGGTEHDAALDRTGITGEAILRGHQVLLADVSAATAPPSTQGVAYDHDLERAPKTVDLQSTRRGGLITLGWFHNPSLALAAGAANPFPVGATWTVASGALPAGVTLNAATGKLSGTATAAGTFDFEVNANVGVGIASTKALRLIVNPPAPPAPAPAPPSPSGPAPKKPRPNP